MVVNCVYLNYDCLVYFAGQDAHVVEAEDSRF